MSYPIKKGRIQSLDPKREFTSKAGKTHSKQDFVLTPVRFNPLTGDPTYASEDEGIPFSVFGPRCADLEGLKVGDEVTVEFDVRGFAYTRQDGTRAYGIDLDVFRVKGPQKAAPAPQTAAAPAPVAETRQAQPAKPKTIEDDLPW